MNTQIQDHKYQYNICSKMYLMHQIFKGIIIALNLAISFLPEGDISWSYLI